jgi:hypothetical protein
MFILVLLEEFAVRLPPQLRVIDKRIRSDMASEELAVSQTRFRSNISGDLDELNLAFITSIFSDVLVPFVGQSVRYLQRARMVHRSRSASATTIPQLRREVSSNVFMGVSSPNITRVLFCPSPQHSQPSNSGISEDSVSRDLMQQFSMAASGESLGPPRGFSSSADGAAMSDAGIKASVVEVFGYPAVVSPRPKPQPLSFATESPSNVCQLAASPPPRQRVVSDAGGASGPLHVSPFSYGLMKTPSVDGRARGQLDAHARLKQR